MNISIREKDRFKVIDTPEHKDITILGSTGSIGTSTLDLISRNPEKYSVKALTANSNVEALAKQAIAHNAEMAVIADQDKYSDLKEALHGHNIIAAAGSEALNEAADMSADWVMSSIVGAAGLKPTLTAIRRGATIALANKECLVCAGEFMMQQVEDCGATILPVDSEHNAIFQIFDFDEPEKIEKVTLTASGGPFWNKDIADMQYITPVEAIKHPNWSMGAKISVDSATMMNKGLELIEAYYMFPIEKEQLDIIIHPKSIIHSMVSYIDGSVLAQLGTPDMRTPISYTLGWPHRMNAPSKKLDLTEIGQLNFIRPDKVKFPAINITREVLQKGGSAPTILNASNEIAVKAFLEGQIDFLDITKVVEKALDTIKIHQMTCLNDVHDVDENTRIVTGEIVEGLKK